MTYLSIRDMAQRLGISESLVRRRSLERGIGLRPLPRVVLFVEADVRRMAPNPPGRPRKSP